MKRRVLSIAVVVGLVTGLMVLPAQADTDEEIEKAIEKGLEWLVAQQQPDGSWPGGDWERVAKTGFAVVKLEERAFELGFESPFDPEYEYSENVHMGLNFIFSRAGVSACCPEEGICFEPGWSETYSTGIAMMAIAASRAPDMVVSVPGSIVDGWTFKQVVEANVIYFRCAQNDDGGWRYQCFDPISDNSNTGYAVLGLAYAKVFGCEIPEELLNNLSGYIDHIQSNEGDPGWIPDIDGGSGYAAPCQWVNLLKTGNLLTEMALAGDAPGSDRLKRAVAYIARFWDDPSQDPGWKGPPPHYQAMYCVMKGLAAYGIETITVDDTEVNWYQAFADAIVATQSDDGSWPGDPWGDQILATEWALLTLEAIIPDVIPPHVECIEWVNPHGKNVPGGKASGKGQGVNPDGFYQLFAEDNRDPNPRIFVGCAGCAGQYPGILPFGPFSSGVVIKFTEAPGATPSMKKIGSTKGQAGAVDWHITLPGEPIVFAVDASGNVAWFPCFVPPPPK